VLRVLYEKICQRLFNYCLDRKSW